MDKKPYREFTIGSAFLVLLIICLATIPAAILQIMLNHLPISTSWSMLITYAIPFVIGLPIIKLIWRSISFKFGKFNAKQTLIAVVIVFAIGIIGEALVLFIPMPDKIAALFDVVLQKNFPTFLCVCIIAPFLEEMVFRGAILGGMLNSGIDARKAIIMSALVFAIIHLNPWQGIPAFAAGLFFGWIYQQTQSLWPCIIMHFTNNTFSYCISNIYDNSKTTVQDIVGNNTIYIAIVIVSIAITYFGIKWLANLFANNKKDI